MKKVLLFVLVLLLAIPAVSFAGSATSRWDLTIGGFVKVDVGYTSQAAIGASDGLEEYFADRNDYQGRQNASNKAGAYDMAAGSSALNFLIKGPDTWGAKTTAFIQGSFMGQTTNGGATGTRYGTFSLTHAYMDFTWANTKLVVGQNWQSWGFLPSYNFLGAYDLLLAGRGNTVPQISVTRNFSKDFYGTLGISEPYNTKDNLGSSTITGAGQGPVSTGSPAVLNGNGTAAGVRVTSQIPDVTGEIGYKSEACGKIGPNMLQLAVGGLWGQDTVVYNEPNPATGGNTGTMAKGNVDRWAAVFKAFIPVIPEKNLNKAGALSLSGSAWTGQNLSNWFLGARGTAGALPYNQVNYNSYMYGGVGRNYAAPVEVGGWGQISYYITDKVYLNGLFEYFHNDGSQNYDRMFTTQLKQNLQYIGNVFYDVNPAVRFAFEYTYIATGYNQYGNVSNPAATSAGSQNILLNSYGHAQMARIAFFYFF